MRYTWILVILALPGCGKNDPPAKELVKTDPRVRLVRPTVRDLQRTVRQPSFIDSYEQTAIYAKLPAYVNKWNVDIGDRIKKDQVLATLFIPELEQEVILKKAQVDMDTALVRQAEKLVDVAGGNLQAALALIAEAKANVGKFEALVVRWQSETRRQQTMVQERVLDRQILDESTRQLQSSVASRDSAQAAVQTAEANHLARGADLEKAKVDVEVAGARLKVAKADEKRAEALYGYTKLLAPYDGIVVLRNINEGDFVQPATGDPSAARRSSDQSAGRASPLYVVARTDIVRVYVDVPEKDANYIVSEVDRKSGDVRPVTKARVFVSAFRDADLPAEVTRSSWALNFKSRTLRAEIDLKNPQAKLLPGMYAFGQVMFERKDARVLPDTTVTEIGNQVCCYFHEQGKALKVPIQTGITTGGWVEVFKKEIAGQWQDFDGKEEVIQGDLSEITDGQKVLVEK